MSNDFTLARDSDDEPRDAPHRSYHLTYEIEIRNLGSQPMEMAYRLDGPTGLPLEGWWYTYKTHPTQFGGAGVRDIVCKAFGDKHKMFTNPKIVKHMEEVQKEMEESPGRFWIRRPRCTSSQRDCNTWGSTPSTSIQH